MHSNLFGGLGLLLNESGRRSPVGRIQLSQLSFLVDSVSLRGGGNAELKLLFVIWWVHFIITSSFCTPVSVQYSTGLSDFYVFTFQIRRMCFWNIIVILHVTSLKKKISPKEFLLEVWLLERDLNATTATTIKRRWGGPLFKRPFSNNFLSYLLFYFKRNERQENGEFKMEWVMVWQSNTVGPFLILVRWCFFDPKQ